MQAEMSEPCAALRIYHLNYVHDYVVHSFFMKPTDASA